MAELTPAEAEAAELIESTYTKYGEGSLSCECGYMKTFIISARSLEDHSTIKWAEKIIRHSRYGHSTPRKVVYAPNAVTVTVMEPTRTTNRKEHYNDYTPTTEEVRDAYLRARYHMGGAIGGRGSDHRAIPHEFNRWLADTLAKHDTEVAATIAEMVRWGRVPPVDSYAANVITSVANWILDPPELVKAPWMKKENDNG